MTDPRGRRGRIVPDPDRTTTPGGFELRPPTPDGCWVHARPDKYACPECVTNRESNEDYFAMAEYLWNEGSDI